jgi:hypothetical protein
MAQLALPPPGFDQLSADEKLEYIQRLWDHFSEHRRWPEVREELLARLRTAR